MRAATRLSVLALGLTLVLGLSKSMTRADDAPATAPKPTGTITGKVVDGDGKGIKGATVNALPGGDAAAAGGRRGGGGGQRPQPLATATTGDDGTYTLDKVPVGKVRLMARLQGTGMGRLTTDVEVTDGKEAKADDIKLAPRGAGGGGGGGRRGGGAGNAAGAGN